MLNKSFNLARLPLTHTKKDSIPENLVLPVKRVYKNFFATSGMFKAFSIKSDGLGGHVASVSWAWIASLRLKALNDVSLVLDEIVFWNPKNSIVPIQSFKSNTISKLFLKTSSEMGSCGFWYF